MNKTITILCNSYPPEKGAGPTRIYNLAHMLQSRGYDVEVVTSIPNYPTGKIFPEYRYKLAKHEVYDGIKVRRLWHLPSNSKFPLKRMVSMITQSASIYIIALPHLLRKRPAIIFVSSPPILLGYTGMIVAKLVGAKSILNISDIWPHSALELGVIKPGKFYNYLENLEKRMYRFADFCVGQSEEILERIEYVLPGRKKKFLYRNLQEISPYAEHARPSGKKKIVYAGMLGIAQGMMDICQQINFTELNVELHIYGEGFEKPLLLNFIKTNPNNGVFYHESIQGKEIPLMLKDYHATLVPLITNIHGAVPSKIFMAISNGLPVLFSGNGEGAKIVKEGKIGWVNSPSDYEGLKNNILLFGKVSEIEYNSIRANCIELAQNTFDKRKQDDAFDDFLQNN